MPATSAQCITGTEKYSGAFMFLNCDDDDDYSQGYGQIKEALTVFTKDDILEPYISDDDFFSSKAGVVEFGYK